MIARLVRLATFAALTMNAVTAGAIELAVEPSAPQLEIVRTDLTTSKGQTVRFPDDLLAKGRPVLLSFTFTGCAMQCPPSDAFMDAVSLEASKPGNAGITLATLTLNPIDDTPERLEKERAHYLSPSRLFLTGHPARVFAVLDGLGMRGGPSEDHAVRFVLIEVDGSSRFSDGLGDPAELYRWANSGN